MLQIGNYFMNKIKLVILIISCLLITSCETTKLLYDSKNNTELAQLGVANPNKRSPKIDTIFPKLDSNFNASAIKYSNRFLSKQTKLLNQNLSYDKPDSLKVIDICKRNNLDGVIITFVEFRLVITQVYFIPTGKYFEYILYSKIVDKNGKLPYSVVHDSKNNSYEKIPTTYNVVNLAVGITYKKIYTIRQKK